ncbi:MAG: hypothetical protein Roseis2KO_51100 [Roseivirga sp.]
MSDSELLQPQQQGIQYTADGLSIGQDVFQSIEKVVWHEGRLNITGTDAQANLKTLSGLSIFETTSQLETQRKRFPNAAIISKCLGLAQLSLGEAALAENHSSAATRFQESISSLERALEQEPGDSEAILNLTLGYCYAEELEDTASEDYAELISELLEEVPQAWLPEIVTACAIRGRVYFEESKATLGFNFLKQELFLWRQQQLLDPLNPALQERLQSSAEALIRRCEAQGWQSIAQQLTAQLTEWTSQFSEKNEADALDARLVDAAEFERAGKAYMSHNDKAAAIEHFEKHTSLMKIIYRDHAPMSCYADLLIESYVRTIDLCYELEEDSKGNTYQTELMELLKSLLITYPKNEFYLHSLSVCSEAMADRHHNQQKLMDALALYRQSLEMSTKLTAADQAPEDYYLHQSDVLKKLIKLYTQMGEHQAARVYHQKVVAIEDRLR